MKSKSKKVTKKSATTKKHSLSSKSKPKAKSSSNLIRTNVNMDRALHSKAKQVAARGNTSLNKLINTAIKEHLK